jgi:hypothetical protein
MLFKFGREYTDYCEKNGYVFVNSSEILARLLISARTGKHVNTYVIWRLISTAGGAGPPAQNV